MSRLLSFSLFVLLSVHGAVSFADDEKSQSVGPVEYATNTGEQRNLPDDVLNESHTSKKDERKNGQRGHTKHRTGRKHGKKGKHDDPARYDPDSWRNGQTDGSIALEVNKLAEIGSYIRMCPCVNADTVEVSDIRPTSDEVMSHGVGPSSFGLSNMCVPAILICPLWFWFRMRA
jgi:hypothetical protein